MSENLKLDKTINIGGVDYDVQAKTAEKVETPLTIFKVVSGTTETPVVFNGHVEEGEAPPEVYVVDAKDGGTFRKPIHVPNKVGTPAATQVLNYADLATIVTNLAGSGWYSWTPHLLGPDNVEYRLTAVTQNNVKQHVGIVLGNSEDLSNFVAENYNLSIKSPEELEETDYYLPKFLYICADNGNLYLGSIASATDYHQIVNEATKLVSTSTEQEYTADSLKEELDKLKQDLSENKTNLENAEKDIAKDYADADGVLDGKITDNAENIRSLNGWLENILESNRTTVKNATQASNANTLDDKDSTYFQKNITISTSAPTNNDGVEGDVWIVWSNS